MSGIEGLGRGEQAGSDFAAISCTRSSSCPCPDRVTHWMACGESGVEELLRQRDAVLQSLEDSRVLSLHMAKWIVEHHQHHAFEKDHACARCVPGAESVVPGFVCALHVATGLFEALQPSQ